MSSPDQLQHFLFSDVDIRGQLVGLEEAYQQVLENSEYPQPIKALIGEFMAAAALLSGTIKVDGKLSIQAQGNGPLSLIMAECGHNQEVRAIARWEGEPEQISLKELLGEGQLVISIEPDQGQRYQGMVPFTGDTLAQCLESYFDQSEQIKTKIWLSSNPGQSAAGLLLQAMPATSDNFDEDAWPRICMLTNTLTETELRDLQNVALIYHLYHQEEVNLYPPSPISFRCSCNRERTMSALIGLGQDELEDIIAEQQELEVKCEICNATYHFTREDLEPYMLELDITKMASDLSPSRTLH